MSDTDLLYTSAVKAAALIRSKRLSPVEYLDAVLKAVDKAQPRLNCFRVVMAEEARRDAKAAEAAVMRGEPPGPLHGVPVSIKDLVDVKGVPTRHGSAIFADNPPAADDDVLVKRLRAAGAIIVGKTNVAELLFYQEGDNPLFGGQTRIARLWGDMLGKDIDLATARAITDDELGKAWLMPPAEMRMLFDWNQRD